MTSVMTTRRVGGMVRCVPLTDQVARMFCVAIGQPVCITVGELALLRKADAATEQWVEQLDSHDH